MTTHGNAIAIVLLAALALLGGSAPSQAASPGQINADVNATIDRLHKNFPGTRDLSKRAAGILVFPSIIKAGAGIGGEYGEGALRIEGRTVAFYSSVSASVGFQFGAQSRAIVIMFMTREALERFQRLDGWKVGVDGSVAIITVGAGGSIDTAKIASPVIGFMLDPKGLMYNLTLEGSKISKMNK